MAAQLIARLDPTIESAWSDEIQKRLSLLDSGAVQAIPWLQAREQITGPQRVALKPLEVDPAALDEAREAYWRDRVV